jgi:hypothetical protein
MKRYHYHRRSLQPLLRAITIISSLTILATGVTYAALQSGQAKLTGNTIQTATAGLKISLNGTDYGDSQTGFSFTDVIPGAAAAPAGGNTFYLKNSGSVALDLKIAVSSTPVNTANVDLSKVYLVLTRSGTQTNQKMSLASLISSNATGGTALAGQLAAASTASFQAQFQMDSDAFSGSSADIGGIDFVFNGTADQ